LTLRVRRRERVVAADHFVPPGDELAKVLVVISIDAVAEEDEGTILSKLDGGGDDSSSCGGVEE
jgi:hypothetical protein